MMAAGGTQLKKVIEDDGMYVWQFHVDWAIRRRRSSTGRRRSPSRRITTCATASSPTACRSPAPNAARRAGRQDHGARSCIAASADRESIVAVHSVNTAAGGGGVRWYEFRVDEQRERSSLHQQGTYAPDGFYRWMASPAIDEHGNIGIGYSFGGTPHFAGQRFAGRLANDPLGS